MQRLKDVNWNQVYYFHEVAKKLSMKDAAKELGVSLPTVSDQIKRLEGRLGISLFRREARRLALTPEGQALYHCSKDIFDAGFRFLDLVAPTSVGGYPVRVGLQETISLMPSIAFTSRYWDVFAPFGTVKTLRELHYEQVIGRLLKHDLDWAIVLEAPKEARIEFREIGSFEIVFCCSLELFRRFKRKEDILRALPLARSTWDKTVNALVEDHLRALGLFPEEILESDHREFCLGLTQRGRCVGTFASETLHFMTHSKTVEPFRVGEPIIVKLYAAWNRANEKTIAIRKLLELLAQPTATEPRPSDPELQLRIASVPPDWLIDA